MRNPTYNIFYDLAADEPALTIAPVRMIPITDAIRADDAARQGARTVHITWTPRLSEPGSKPKPKTHTPSKDPRKRASQEARQKQRRECEAKRRKRRKEAGLCTQCGVNEAKRSRCEGCLLKNLATNNRYYERKKVRHGEA